MATAPQLRRIVILTVPPVLELDLVAIVQVFGLVNEIIPGGPRYRIEVVTVDRQGRTPGAHGLTFSGGRHYTTLTGEMDTLLVPGGKGASDGKLERPVADWLRKNSKKCRRYGSICTGAFVLAQAGLLDGKRATTHWAYARALAERFPKVTVDSNPIWIQDGNLYTSAGITSGIDLCLALVEEDHGSKVALEVARMLVVFLRRPGNQKQFSVSLAVQSTERRPLQDLQVWIAENLRADLSVPTLASRVAMSPRNFQRVFTREIGKAPAHYVEELRVEAARRKLERTTQSLEEIADACGFGSANVMGRSFHRILQITPGEYRSCFQSSGIPKKRESVPPADKKPLRKPTDGRL